MTTKYYSLKGKIESGVIPDGCVKAIELVMRCLDNKISEKQLKRLELGIAEFYSLGLPVDYLKQYFKETKK